MPVIFIIYILNYVSSKIKMPHANTESDVPSA